MLPRNHPDRIQITFDDRRLVANAGLLLPATLARHLGLPELVRQRLDLGDAPGRANTSDRMMTLVASALARGDCIDDADVLRTGGTACTLDVVVDGFMGRPLDAGPYPYLWLDALTQNVREDGRLVNVSVVVATAVNGEGKREIIGMDVGTSEDGAFWLAFLRSLSARGLSGVELVVSDAHQGLRGAIPAVFGGASWQRCRTHFMTNLLTRVPRRAQPWVATMVRTIYQQPSPDEVHAQLDRVTDQLQNRFPQVASLLDEAGPDVLAFSNFPLAHWKKIWSNNPQERLNKEIRRRTDVVGIFPNRPAVRRLVGAVLAEQNDEWAVARRYITPVVLTFNKALPEADLAEATAA